jgi:hypothetical protein
LVSVVEGVSKQRYISAKQGDTIAFTLTNAAAFALHGGTNHFRKGLQVTVTPPADEGPPRIRTLNDSIPDSLVVNEVIHYFESGLNRSSRYEVELLNPFTDSNVDLRYLQILDAVPQSAAEPGASASSRPSVKQALRPGAVAGIVVGLAALNVDSPSDLQLGGYRLLLCYSCWIAFIFVPSKETAVTTGNCN